MHLFACLIYIDTHIDVQSTVTTSHVLDILQPLHLITTFQITPTAPRYIRTSTNTSSTTTAQRCERRRRVLAALQGLPEATMAPHPGLQGAPVFMRAGWRGAPRPSWPEGSEAPHRAFRSIGSKATSKDVAEASGQFLVLKQCVCERF